MSTLCKMSNDQFNAFSSVKGLIIAFMCSSFIIDPKYVALLFLDYWKQKQKKKERIVSLYCNAYLFGVWWSAERKNNENKLLKLWGN